MSYPLLKNRFLRHLWKNHKGSVTLFTVVCVLGDTNPTDRTEKMIDVL